MGTIDMLQTMKPDMGSMHKEDLIQLGKLILQLSSRSVSPVDDLPSALDKLRKSYSPALHSLVSSLLTNSSPYPSIDEISSSIAPFILHELEHTSKSVSFFSTFLFFFFFLPLLLFVIVI